MADSTPSGGLGCRRSTRESAKAGVAIAMKTIALDGLNLECVRLVPARWRVGTPAIVFLHDALGSVSTWRDFPRLVADATGCEAVVYSREGSGGSDPARSRRGLNWMHAEAVEVLPALIDTLRLDRPFLFGHSDGATIALLCAGATRTPISGLIVVAPHVMIEETMRRGIRKSAKAFRSMTLRQRLARHHSAQYLDTVLSAWQDAWLDPACRDWNIESCLSSIQCPILAVQGQDDEFGSLAHLHRIEAQAPDVTVLKLADCGHSPHRDRPEALIEATTLFIDRLVPSGCRRTT